MYNVTYKGRVRESFDSMREAEEYIQYLVFQWPSKYDEDDFDIVKE